ncbi:MAG: hypothetical protein ACT4N8_00235 [Sphingosinicella sp.]|uniref:hypothetical protein n=1 Tax=Sphingosinicella sp. TaxID=1917971 RepID=UPI004037E71E
MPDYRLYLLNPFSGHIDGVEQVSASDDIEAICLVQNGGRKVPVELWRGGVKVVHIDAPPEIVPPAPNGAPAANRPALRRPRRSRADPVEA